MKKIQFTLKNLFDQLLENNSPRRSKNKHRKFSRSCRIEELEGREMLSGSPMFPADVYYDQPDTVENETVIVDVAPEQQQEQDYQEQDQVVQTLSGVVPTSAAAAELQPLAAVSSPTASDPTATSIKLTWTGAADTPIVQYKVTVNAKNKAVAAKNQVWITADASALTAATKTGAVVNGLSAGTTYKFRVSDDGGATWTESETTLKTAAAAGDKLAKFSGVVTVVSGSITATGFKVSWNPVDPTNTNIQYIVSYTIPSSIKGVPGTVMSHVVSNSSTPSIILTGLKPGVSYKVSVVAQNKETGMVNAAKTKTVKTTKVTGPTKLATAAGKKPLISSIELQWKAAPVAVAQKIEVWVPVKGGAPKLIQTISLAASATSYNVENLEAGTKYTFRVVGVNEKGEEVTAAISKAITTAKWTAPSKLKAVGVPSYHDAGTGAGLVVTMTLPKLPLGATASDYTEFELFNTTDKKNYKSLGFITATISADGKTATMVVPQSMISAGGSKFGVWAVSLGVDEDGNPVVVNHSAMVAVTLTGSKISTTPVAVTVPAPAGFVVTQTTDSSVSLRWDEIVGLPTGAAIDHYEIQYRTGEGAWTTLSVTGTTTTISGLTMGTQYEFEIHAVVNVPEADSLVSAVARTTVKTEGFAVTVVGQTSMWNVVLKWNVLDDAPEVSNYQISVFLDGVPQTLTSWSTKKIADGVFTFTFDAPYPPTGTAGLRIFDFDITAVDGDGNVLASDTVSAKWLAPPTVTYPVQESPTSISVTWADTYNHPNNVTYNLSIFEDGKLLRTVTGLTAADRIAGVVFSGLTTGKTYTFKAVAIDVTEGYVSLESTSSTPNSVKLMNVSTPSDLSFVQTGERTVTVSWTSDPTLEYDLVIGSAKYSTIISKLSEGYQWIPKSTSYSIVVTLSPSATPYDYTITTSAGKTTQTTTGTITLKTLTAPSDLKALQGSGEEVLLTWTVDPKAAKYVVERSLTSTGGWTALAEVTTGSYTDTDVVADGTTYYYRVAAYISSDAAWRVVSNTASVTITGGDEGIKNVKIVQKPDELAAVITWDGIADPMFYQVSFWDGTNEYTWMYATSPLDITEGSDDDEEFIPVPGVEYEITIVGYDNSSNEFETTIYFTFEDVSTPPEGKTKRVIDFEFLALPDYLGLNNSWPHNLFHNKGDAFDIPGFVTDEFGLDDAPQYVIEAFADDPNLWQYFIDGVGFTISMDYDDYYNMYAWYGFGLSTETDTTYVSTDNEMSSVTGSGANNSLGYGIAYWMCQDFDYIAMAYIASCVMQLPEGALIDSMMITNTVYSHGSMTYGDSFTNGPLGDDQYHTLVVVGLDADGNKMTELGEVRCNLGDYGVVIDDWVKLNLAPLAGASQLQFSFVSNNASYGDPNFPVYFAFDDIVYYI
ncbi:MAG: fibronectin type III domain-containing protein [Planctomycetaceae bacterium]|jgi:hypothetical protein|nr:fibronectin type III domain-containing protein [Planctomycetaceae bacterium]